VTVLFPGSDIGKRVVMSVVGLVVVVGGGVVARNAFGGHDTPVRKLVPARQVTSESVGGIDVVTTKESDGTLKVVSARQDLTGYEELGWAADRGERIGDVRCTQRIKISADTSVRTQSTLLLCWRTSSSRSVYTVAVKYDGRPSEQVSAAEIDRVWVTLGGK
jgi:hypothetical protein